MVRVSFLMSGPMLELTLNNALEPTPSLSSPVELVGSGGGGGRSVTYLPEAIDKVSFTGAIYTDLAPIRGFGDRIVRIVEHREADLDEPVQWYLLWDLSVGTMLTHVSGEDGFDSVETTAAHLEIIEQENTTPIVLPQHPLRRAASAQPGYEETITFQGLPDSGASLTLMRPGRLRRGVSTSEGVIRLQTGFGVDIESSGIGEDYLLHVEEELNTQLSFSENGTS